MKTTLIIMAFCGAVILHLGVWAKIHAPDREEVQHAGVTASRSTTLKIADLHAGLEGDKIVVSGWVTGFWEPVGPRAPHKIILCDKSGALEVVHWLKQPLPVEVGDQIQCRGTVDLYKGELQLRLWSLKDIQPIVIPE